MSVYLARTQANRRNRRGLTLMELVVVMVVLAALAAILIPLFPNFLRRSHKVTEATQASEISKAVQLYQASYLQYPDEWDLMTVSSGTTAPNFLPADGGNTFGNGAQIGNLGASEVAALERVGIVSGHHFPASGPAHPTENPYASPITTPPTTLSTSTPVFIIDSTTSGEYPPEIVNLVQRDNTARFVVFGVGARTTMVGKVMQSAPILAPTGGGLTPSNVYSRFGAVFQVAGAGVTTTKRARFVGTVILEDDALEGGEHALIGYYDVAKSGE